MKRKIIRIILALLLAGALLVLAAAAASRVVYGRSLRATAYEWVLRRRYASTRTAEEEIARLEKRRAAGEKPYALPENLRLRAPVAETAHDGMQVFTLNPDAAGPTVVYLHGGAFINPFNAYQWRFMDRLASETEARVVAPAYHLAPWADYRRAYDDLLALWETLPDNPVILMGDSAGGGLALGLAEALVKAGTRLPDRLVLFSPWVDLSMDNPDIPAYAEVDPILRLELVRVHGRYWAGNGDTHHWQVSPLYGDMAGLPPTDIYCGARELLYPDIVRLSEGLTRAGVETRLTVGRGLNHDYPLMPLPEADRAVREVVEVVRELGIRN